MQQVAQGIRTRCRCDFNETHFVTPTMQCRPDSPNSPTFRAAVVDVVSSNGAVVNSRDIVGHVASWVETNPTIMSGLASITIDPSCPITPASFEEAGCSDSSSSITVTALVGALIIEFIVLCIIGFVTFAIFVTVFTSRRKIQQKLMKQRKYVTLLCGREIWQIYMYLGLESGFHIILKVRKSMLAWLNPAALSFSPITMPAANVIA